MMSVLPLAFTFVLSTGCKKAPPEDATAAIEDAPFAQEEPEETAIEEETLRIVPAPVSQMVENFQLIYFDFDSPDLSDISKNALTENVAIMQKHPNLKLELQGHSDERGTTDYNLALGQKRGDIVYEYMTVSGVSSDRLRVVSYGEEQPRDQSQTEHAWSKNRRCEFVITWGGSNTVEGTTNG